MHHPYRADSDIAYLTGFEEPEAVLVLLPDRAEGESVLFVRPSDPDKEIWTGRRAGVKGNELHIYPKGGHGYGLRPSDHPVVTWPARAGDWMKAMGWLKR